MIAFDTNMLIRLVVDDHPAQADIAQQLLRQDTAWISRTVLLESEWVLRSRYTFPRDRILAFFRLLLQAENASVETPQAVEQALSWFEQGADLADALHLAVCGDAVMQTFDRGFCKQSRETGTAPEVRVWEL